jgi:hypothetical protein
LTLAIAVDALGAEKVQAVMMPSRYTADMSREDAAAQARAQGVRYSVIPIEGMFAATLGALEAEFAGRPVDATEENIQSRCRMQILMGISNKTGKMLLTTGNKSEMAVGYATSYGDMAGGFAPIKDCSKLVVYRLATYRILRRRHSAARHRSSAVRRVAARSKRQRLAAALTTPSILYSRASSKTTSPSMRSSRAVSIARPLDACSISSSAPNTSDAKRRRACGFRAARSVAIGGIRLRTGIEGRFWVGGSVACLRHGAANPHPCELGAHSWRATPWEEACHRATRPKNRRRGKTLVPSRRRQSSCPTSRGFSIDLRVVLICAPHHSFSRGVARHGWRAPSSHGRGFGVPGKVSGAARD